MSLISQLLLRTALMAIVIGVAFVPLFWLFKWNHQNQQSALVSALIAGAFIAIAAGAYRILVRGVAARADAHWKARAKSDG